MPDNPLFSSVVNVRIGETLGTATFLGQIPAGAGTSSFDFDYPALGGDDFDTLFLSDGEGAIYQLQDMSIKKQSACADTYYSECYNLDECTEKHLLLQWTNDENGLGFNYAQLGFIQQLRVEGGIRILSGTYEDETFYTTSGGVRGQLYSQPTKNQEMWVHEIPEYLHNAIRLAIAHDHFFIDGTEYVKQTDRDWETAP